MKKILQTAAVIVTLVLVGSAAADALAGGKPLPGQGTSFAGGSFGYQGGYQAGASGYQGGYEVKPFQFQQPPVYQTPVKPYQFQPSQPLPGQMPGWSPSWSY